MKALIVLFVAAIAVAGVAFLTDSWFLLMGSVALLGATVIGLFVLGVQAAQKKGIVIPYVAALAAGLVVSAVAVASIVIGAWDDAPGMVLLGSALITSVVVGLFTLGLRATQRIG